MKSFISQAMKLCTLPIELLDYILCTFTTDNELFVARLVCREWSDRIFHLVLKKRALAKLKLNPSKFVYSQDLFTLALDSGCRSMLSWRLFSAIIQHGNLETLKLARANNCPWVFIIFLFTLSFSK